jgi:hypothetical protein
MRSQKFLVSFDPGVREYWSIDNKPAYSSTITPALQYSGRNRIEKLLWSTAGFWAIYSKKYIGIPSLNL